jgi:hypothetical protein
LSAKRLKHHLTKLHRVESLKKSRFSRANLAVFAIIFASIGGYLIYSSFAAVPACSVNASTSNFSSVYSSASTGSVICLAAGDYGSFSGSLKSGNVTITRDPSLSVGQVSMTINFSSASNITIDGLTIKDGSIIQGSQTKNITVANSDFPGQITLAGGSLANSNVTLDHNVHHDFTAVGNKEGRVYIPNNTSQSTGITIKNSQFLRGNSDGIQNGGNNVKILNNEFADIHQLSGAENPLDIHADSIQLYGSNNTVIQNNYFHNVSD